MGYLSRQIDGGRYNKEAVRQWLTSNVACVNGKVLRLSVRGTVGFAVLQRPAAQFTENGTPACPYSPDERGLVRELHVLKLHWHTDEQRRPCLAVRVDPESCGPNALAPPSIIVACSGLALRPAGAAAQREADAVRAYRTTCLNHAAKLKTARTPGALLLDRAIEFADRPRAVIVVTRGPSRASRAVRYHDTAGTRLKLTPSYLVKRGFTWFATAAEAETRARA